MRSRRGPAGVLVGVMAVVALGATLGGVAAAAGPPAGSCDPAVAFDPARFPATAGVGNTFLPLVPGRQLVFEGVANRGGGLLAHRVAFTTTGLVKVIDGVQSIVVWDTDFNEGDLKETELAFFAQDLAGNVWNLGEYPEEYEFGAFLGAPSTWVSGQEGAVGGVHMLADPQLGTPEYLQGDAPSVEFLDSAVIAETGGSLCGPTGCYENVLTTHERSPLDPAGGVQTKAHGPGVGIVEIGAIDDPEGETLRLVEVNHLDAAALEQANLTALELDARGYENSAAYASTPPAERAGGSPPPVPTEPVPPPTGGGGPEVVAPPTTMAMGPPPTATPVREVSGPASAGRAGGNLGFTGSDATRAALVATIFLLVGFAFVVLARLPRRMAAATTDPDDGRAIEPDPTSLSMLCVGAIRVLDDLLGRPDRTTG